MTQKFFTKLTTVIVIYLCLTAHTFAQCNKEDIAFYLEKGFTQDQITQLCSTTNGTSSESVPDYTPYQQKVIIYQEGAGPGVDKDGFTREEREAIKALEAGGDVTALKVTSDEITYTRKVCIFTSNGKEYDDRFKACPETNFSITRKSIKVSHSGKKLLILGTGTVQVEGNISRKTKRGFDEYPLEFRRELERKFNWTENGKVTDFPVRGDFSVTRIVNAFRTLASTADQTEDSTQVAEKENIIKEVADKKKEKKKRWWNPFD